MTSVQSIEGALYLVVVVARLEWYGSRRHHLAFDQWIAETL